MNSTALHSTSQHSTAQHGPARHSIAQHSTCQHCTAQHSKPRPAPHGTAQHRTAQHSTGHLARPAMVCHYRSDTARSCDGESLLFRCRYLPPLTRPCGSVLVCLCVPSQPSALFSPYCPIWRAGVVCVGCRYNSEIAPPCTASRPECVTCAGVKVQCHTTHSYLVQP